jgi:hypothetical protein
MKVKLIGLLILLLLVLASTISVAETTEYDETMRPNERCMTEFIEIALEKIEDRQALLYVSPSEAQKNVLLEEFHLIIRETRDIQNASIGYVNMLDTVISWSSGSLGSVSGKFYIAFSDERYFELVDLLLDFTSIDRESLVVKVEAPLELWCFEIIEIPFESEDCILDFGYDY